MLNNVTLQGRIPDSEGLAKTYIIHNEGDEKRAVLNFKLSVRRNYKAADAQYAKDDLIDCKAFGRTANSIYTYFKPGDNLLITGSIEHDEPYTDKNGATQYGGMYVKIDSFNFQYAQARQETETVAPVAAPARPAAPKAGARPTTAPARPAAPAFKPTALKTPPARPSLLRQQ